MKKIFLLMLLLSIAMVPAMFAGGAKEGTAKPAAEPERKYDYVFGKVPYTLEHAYHQSETKILTEYAAKMYNAKVIVIDGQANAEATLKAIENLISQGVDALAMHTGDAGLSAKAVKMAHAKGIPIVTTLIRPDIKEAPHIQPMETASSQYMGAESARQWLKAHPDKPCIVAELDFGTIPQITEMRTGAFFDGVKSVDPKAKLVGSFNGYGNTVKSMEVTLDILQGNPGVNIIFGANDEMALGALAACEQLGRGKMNNGVPITEVIAGLDGSTAALVKIFDPNCSFKLTHGAVRDVARAEADTMYAMVTKKIPMNEFVETQVLSAPIDFWHTTLTEAQRFLEDNFFYTGDLKADVAAAAK